MTNFINKKIFQYPPEHQSNVGAPKLEYPGQLPRLTLPEKHFIIKLLSDIPKDAVSICLIIK